jgi:hypothetical protein
MTSGRLNISAESSSSWFRCDDGSWAMDPLDPSDPLIRISFFVDAGLTSDPNSS